MQVRCLHGHRVLIGAVTHAATTSASRMASVVSSCERPRSYREPAPTGRLARQRMDPRAGCVPAADSDIAAPPTGACANRDRAEL